MTVATFEEQFLRRLVDVLDSHYRDLHQAASDSWADVDEGNFSEGGQAILQIQPQAENEFRVDLICGYVAAAANQAGLLELGTRHRIVVPGNAVFALAVRVRLKNTDQRILSVVTTTNGNPGARGSGTPGFLWLHLGGREIPPGAVRW